MTFMIYALQMILSYRVKQASGPYLNRKLQNNQYDIKVLYTVGTERSPVKFF